MKCKLLYESTENVPTLQYPTGVIPAGSVIEHPDAFHLVRMGIAEPVDDECRLAADRTPGQLIAAQDAYAKVKAGIHPDDFAAFDRGEMVGYDADGRPIPGPNFCGSEDDFENSALELSEVLDND